MARSQSEPNPTTNRLPDLYRLLELTPLESSRSKIEAALKRAHRVAKQLQTSDPSKSRKAAKLFEMGKRTLLDPRRKADYDNQWKSEFNGDGGWRWEALTEFLPSGNPDAAFDLSTFLTTAEVPEDNRQAEFLELKDLLSGNPNSKLISQNAPSEAEPIRRPAAPIVKAQSVTVATPVSTFSSPKSLARKIRNKRDRSLLSATAAVLAGLAIVLSVLFFVLQQDAGLDPKTPAFAKQSDAASDNDSPRESTKPPQGSGLPKVRGLETNDVPTTEQNDPQSNEVIVDSKETILEPPMQEATMPIPPVASAAGIPDDELSDVEKSNWQETMRRIRGDLGQQNYAEAKIGLQTAQEQAKTKTQIDQLIRLRQAAMLAEQCHDAIVAAIKNLSAGETFIVGTSTPVSFVDGNEESVTLRLLGQNQTYVLTELKIGLAYGLADLQMDVAHPNSLAAKAAFALFHPVQTDAALQRARQDMQTAIDSGVLPAEVRLVFDDDYSL